MSEKFAYNVAEIAHITGLRQPTLRDWIRRGRIPKLDLPDRAVLVPAWALEVWKTTSPHQWPGDLPEGDPRRNAPQPADPPTAA